MSIAAAGAAVFACFLNCNARADSPSEGGDIFARRNLVAWCIVPFDSMKRGPEERAQMLDRLGIRRLAYDYRAEHIPTFDAEMDALQKHGIELVAWWFPGSLNDEAKGILDVIKRHGVHPQLWVTGGGGPVNSPEEQAKRVEQEAARLRPIAEAAAQLGLKMALYNHGGWFGEPENQLAIVEKLGLPNVGLVYNFHHGHEHIARFPALWKMMQPHLLAVNFNGMVRDGDKQGKMILPIGVGTEELAMLRVIRDSGWRGPVGILNHRPEMDAEVALKGNLEGLERLAAALASEGGQRPKGGAAPTGPGQGEGVTGKPRDTGQGEGVTRRQGDSGLTLSPPHPVTLSSPAPAEDAEFQIIPAAKPEALTPANGWPAEESWGTWSRSLGGPTSNRFSSLSQIHRGNVAQLQVAWTYHSGDGVGNIQCNPIIVDGVMYIPTPGRNIVAVDAATGAEIWRFAANLTGHRLEDAPARRGLIHWPGDGEGAARLIFAGGNWIFALDPKTGKAITSFGKEGRTELPMGGTAVGAIWRHVYVVPGFNGDVFGYDVISGKMLWRFHTIPEPGEFGAETWRGREVGANCWGGMAMDESRGIAYIGTGSPKPNFNGTGHLGRNLFGNCVIALKAETGERLWHFQEIRHDIWDLDIPAPPNLVTVMREGRRVDAVAQVTKIGNTLLLDRVTGEPLFPFHLRRAPASRLPGEETWPYQPDVELPEPFSPKVFTRDDITDRTPEAHAFIEQRLVGANMGWFAPFEAGKPTAFYGLHGGAEWTGAAFDPHTGRLYISGNTIPWVISVFRDDDAPPAKPATAGEQLYQQFCAACHGPDRGGIGTVPPLRGLRHRLRDEDVRTLWKTGRNLMPPQPQFNEAQQRQLLDFLFVRDRPQPPDDPNAPPRYSFGGYHRLVDQEDYPGCKPPWGVLNCLDLNTGKLVWKVPLGDYEVLNNAGVPKTGTENFGGAMVTAGGLVFCSGTRDRKIRAFDSASGAELWQAPLPLHGTAPPATYEAKGRQFIVLPATGDGKLGGPSGDAWVAFALPE